MVDETALKKARSGLLRLLSYRQRSRREAQEYLQRKGFSEKVIAYLLKEMEQWNYIDDRRYAIDYTENCLRRGLGPLRARRDLISRGISRNIVEEEVPRQYSPEIELSLARTLLNKRTGPDDDWHDIRLVRRQAAYLHRRGFRESIVIKVIRERSNQVDH